ncbi:MAG: hypothetical protein LC799_20310, partial [Actinobacteria bacterium]|nr:hypothetical protein [Actinomycetota bacterium]
GMASGLLASDQDVLQRHVCATSVAGRRMSIIGRVSRRGTPVTGRLADLRDVPRRPMSAAAAQPEWPVRRRR